MDDVPFHKREESGLKDVRALELVGILPKEEDTLVYELADTETHDLAKVAA